MIKQGEKVVYTFDIDPEKDLSYPGANNGKLILDNGDYYLMVGSQKVKFEVTD